MVPNDRHRDPTRDRPDIPAAYGVESDIEGTLAWDQVAMAIDQAEIYWIATTGRHNAHLVPVHAAGLGGTIYAGGDRNARWCMNLASNPASQVGIEFDGLQVMSRGVSYTQEPDPDLLEAINTEVDRKYGFTYGTGAVPMWVLEPQTVIAFEPSAFATSPTRFRFDRRVPTTR